MIKGWEMGCACSASALALWAVSLCVAAAELSRNSAYDNLPGTVETPHVKWAKPYYLGKLRVLVVAPTWTHRETVELAQRLDIAYFPIMTSMFDNMYKWYDPTVDGKIIAGRQTVDRIIRERLAQDYDVIVVGKLSWQILAKEFRYKLLKKVHEGAGLVYVCPHDCGDMAEPVFERRKTDAEREFITTGVPFPVLPVLKSVPLAELVSLSEFAKGRVVKLDYKQAASSQWLGLTPVPDEDWPLAYDYYHSLLAKAVLWAARRVPHVSIRKLEATTGKLELGFFHGKKTPEAVDVQLAVRDKASAVEHTQRIAAELKPGANALAFELPPLKAGMHFLDVWVKQGGKTITWGSTAMIVETKYRIADLVLDKQGYKLGETVRGKVVVNQAPGEKLALSIQLWDSFGRLMDEQRVEVAGKETSFAFGVKEALSILLRVKAVLRNHRQVLSEASREFPVVRHRKAGDDYFFVMWGDCSPQLYLAGPLFRQFRRMGVDAMFPRDGIPARAWAAARASVQTVPYCFGTFGSWGGAEVCKGTIRKPCLNDPSYREGLKEGIQQWAPTLRDLGIPGYSLTIQGALTRSAQEFCFCPRCTKGFQDYARKHYGNLEAADREWGTKHASWEAIKPITFAEAGERGNYAQWADFRMYMEHVYTDLNAFCKREIQKIDPEAIVGFNEPQDATSYRGFSWWKLLRAVDMCGLYVTPGCSHTDVPKEIVRSFMEVDREGCITGGWIGCYGYSEGFNRAMPWRILFHSGESIWWWEGFFRMGPGGWTSLTADLAPLPYFQQSSEEIREIKRGIGKLLLHSTREHDGIAIHYSPLSIHASTIDPSKTEITESQRAFIYALEDIGLQYNFVANEQIEAGELGRKGYKVLVLPYAQALSAAEVARIKEFVQAGGMVLADFTPGVMDAHCRRLKASPLEEVFGGFGPGVRTHAHGKGTAVYLGDLLKDYISLREAGKEAEKRAKLTELLKAGGVTPRLRITTADGKDLPATETVLFRNGQAEYVCLLKDYTVQDQSKRKVTVTFPRKAHVYDVRARHYCGHVEQVETEIAPARAKVFALLPYEVKRIALRLDKKTYRRAEAVSYQIAINASSQALSTHGLRLELVGPDGRVAEHYGQNILAASGRHSGTRRLSLNERTGQWLLRVRDIASGVAASGKFAVE